MSTFNRRKAGQVELDKYHFWVDDDENYGEGLLISNVLKLKRYSGIYSRYSFRSLLISVFGSDRILKLFAIVFYGVLPRGFKKHSKNLKLDMVVCNIYFAAME